MVKCLPTMQETWVQSLGQEDLLEKKMATPSSILARKVICPEEPGRLQSMGWQSRTQLRDFASILLKVKVRGLVLSVVCGSLRPQGLYPARLLCPWDSLGIQQWSGLQFPPSGNLLFMGFSRHSPRHATVEWVAIRSSRVSSWPRDQIWVS